MMKKLFYPVIWYGAWVSNYLNYLGEQDNNYRGMSGMFVLFLLPICLSVIVVIAGIAYMVDKGWFNIPVVLTLVFAGVFYWIFSTIIHFVKFVYRSARE